MKRVYDALKLFLNERGVVYNADNYAAQFVTVPGSKFPKGEVSGKARWLIDRKTLVQSDGASFLQSGDTIKGPYIPASSLVIDAFIHCDDTTQGVWSLGNLASSDGTTHAADADSFVISANSGGQEVFQRAATASNVNPAGILQRYTKEVQTVVTCVTTQTANASAVLTFGVCYLSD